MSVSSNANKIIESVDNGWMTWEQVARGAIAFMNDDQLGLMAHHEEFVILDSESEEEEYWEVSYVTDSGGETLLERFEGDEDARDNADAYADEYNDDNNVTTIVEHVTDNGGSRTELYRYKAS